MNSVEKEWQLALENPWPKVKWRRLRWAWKQACVVNSVLGALVKVSRSVLRVPECVRYVAPGMQPERVDRFARESLRGKML